jgi:hypothetical protein
MEVVDDHAAWVEIVERRGVGVRHESLSGDEVGAAARDTVKPPNRLQHSSTGHRREGLLGRNSARLLDTDAFDEFGNGRCGHGGECNCRTRREDPDSVGTMATVTLVYVLIAALLVFVIAAVVVGREAHRLDAIPPRSVYIPEEALEFVAEYLPGATQARLTPDELEQLLRFHMQWLHSKGLQPSNVIDRRQDITEPVVISELTVVAYLLGEAERNGIDVLDDADVVNVVDAHLAYFEAIGAVGPLADDPDLPAP